MYRYNRDLLILLLLIVCIGCDQLTKDIAQQYLAVEPPQAWFHDMVRLEYAENTWAFPTVSGTLSHELRILLFRVFPALSLVVLTIYLLAAKQMPVRSAITWGLVLSAGLGNLLGLHRA